MDRPATPQSESASDRRGGAASGGEDRAAMGSSGVPWWRRGGAIRAVVIFLALMGPFYAWVYTPGSDEERFLAYHEFIAWLTRGLLSATGFPARGWGTFVDGPDFSFRIISGCDAIEPTAAFLAALIATPAALGRKLLGALVGMLVLAGMNIVRVASLFLIRLYARPAMDFMHEDVWQAAFIVLAIALWAIWVRWAGRQPERAGTDAT